MVPRVVLGAAVAALITACSFQGGVGPGFQCGEGDWCPAGQVCQAGTCTADPAAPDAAFPPDGASDAVPPDGAVPEPRCGTLSLLRDDFGDGVIGDQWDAWNDTGVTVQESGGALVVELAQGTGDLWGGVTSNARYDLTDGTLEAEVLEVGGEYTMIEAVAHTGVGVQIYVRNGMITAAVWPGPLAGERAQEPYDAGVHRYWRLRESGGTLYWETSPDRQTWNVLHEEAPPIPLGNVTGGVLGGVQLAGGVTRARFGDVNLGAPVGLVFCPGTDLVDDFEDGVIDPGLRVTTASGCTVSETGGVLRFSYNSSGFDRCQVKSEHLFDLRDSEVRIDAGGAFDGDETESWFQFEDRADTTTRLEIQVGYGVLEVTQRLENVNTDFVSVPFDAVAHRWWRIRGAAGRVYLETSPDAVTWTPRIDAPAAFDFSDLRLELGAETYDAALAPVSMTFDVASMNTN